MSDAERKLLDVIRHGEQPTVEIIAGGTFFIQTHGGILLKVCRADERTSDAQDALELPPLHRNAVYRPCHRSAFQVAGQGTPIDDARQKALDCGFAQLVVHASSVSGFRNVPRSRCADEAVVLSEVLTPCEQGVPPLDAVEKLGTLQFAVVQNGHPARRRGIERHHDDIRAVVQIRAVATNFGPQPESERLSGVAFVGLIRR